MSPSNQCPDCQDTYENDKGDPCTECCPHNEHDHGICLDCSKDLNDTHMGLAESTFEGDR